MGMSCSLHRATSAQIDHLLEVPEALGRFLDLDGGGAPQTRQVRQKGLGGLLLRLLPITIEETVPEPRDPAPRPPTLRTDSIDIEKAWHGLHFLFTGTAEAGDEPACYLMRGGEAMDDEGFARALRPDQVRRFAAFLAGLSARELKGRFDATRMTKLDIYPSTIWQRPAEGGESPVTWLIAAFEELKSFVDRAAEANDGVIVHIA